MDMELTITGTNREYTVKHDKQGNEQIDKAVVVVNIAPLVMTEEEYFDLLQRVKEHKVMVKA